MVFGHYGRTAPSVALELYAQPTPQVNRVRYLGIHLTPQLSWNYHISVVSAKLRPRVGSLYALSKRNILNKRTCVLLYKSLLESLVAYGAPALRCMPLSAWNQLTEMQAHCLRALLDLPFEVEPCDALAFAGVDSIEETFMKAFDRYGDRCLAANTDMAEYVKFVANLKPADEKARQVLDDKCPAWHLRNKQRTFTLTADNRLWLTIEN